MGSNRAQRRAAKHKGKRPGETYADVLTRKKMIEEAVRESVHDTSITIEADIKTQRYLWMSVIALNEAFGFGGGSERRNSLLPCKRSRRKLKSWRRRTAAIMPARR